MQAIEQPRLRKTPFGDTPAPTEPRISGDLFNRAGIADAGSAYDIFSLMPALDGLGGTARRPIEWRL